MKKIISLALSLIMILSVFSCLNFTVYAEDTNSDSTDSTFPYSDSDIYVADRIIKGIIDKDEVAYGSAENSMALLHNYNYNDISEVLIEDSSLV